MAGGESLKRRLKYVVAGVNVESAVVDFDHVSIHAATADGG